MSTVVPKLFVVFVFGCLLTHASSVEGGRPPRSGQRFGSEYQAANKSYPARRNSAGRKPASAKRKGTARGTKHPGTTKTVINAQNAKITLSLTPNESHVVVEETADTTTNSTPAPNPVEVTQAFAQPRPQVQSPQPSTGIDQSSNEALALETIKASVRLRYGDPGQFAFTITSAESSGGVANPITARGLVEVEFKRKLASEGGTVRHRYLSNKKQRKAIVIIDAQGMPQIVDNRSAGLLRGKMASIAQRIPVKRVVSDLIQTKSIAQSIQLAVVGAAVDNVVTQVPTTATSGVVLFESARRIATSLNEQRVARRDALSKTITELKARVAAPRNETVTFGEAYYRHYLGNAGDIGVREINEIQFARALILNGL